MDSSEDNVVTTTRCTIDCPARKPLAACLALLLGFGVLPPCSAFTVRTVTNCNDNGPGSLRAAMLASQDQDSVDLSSLVCSTITLTTGALPAAGTLLLTAFNRAAPVVIDGGRYQGRHDRVIVHNGLNGHLYLSNVSVANADYSGPDPRGGCILSSGSVNVGGGMVKNCHVSGTGIAAKGGGVYAVGNVTPFNGAIISNNIASAINANAYGGGIFAGGFTPQRSTISDNVAEASPGFVGLGGGAYAFSVLIEQTTLSGNQASRGGALVFHPGSAPFAPRFIVNSTISGNTASNSTGGVLAYGSLYVSNSTIAFNSSTIGPAGLYVAGATNFLQLDSSIIALNTVAGVMFDLDAAGPITGAHNLVTAGLSAPGDTLSSCPRMAPLRNYGFLTQTHALLPGSPAFDAGSNPNNQVNDQRKLPRTVGAAADIGAFEVQAGERFDEVFNGGFENRCQ